MHSMTVLTTEDVEQIQKAIKELSFSDGKNSAQGETKKIKRNTQIIEGSKGSSSLFNGLRSVLMKSTKVQMVACPRSIANIMINRYEPGEEYGWHVDNAHMNGKRTDLSFTIFLNDPSSYEGGELEMRHPTGHVSSFKGEPGQMILYSTGLLHRVTPVKSGVRLCIVGWFESFIQNDLDRQLVFEMVKLFSELRTGDASPTVEQKDMLNELQFKMIRRLSA